MTEKSRFASNTLNPFSPKW